MYKSFYNLDSRPFETHPDPSFLWLGENHKEALTLLRCGIRENKGFLLLTGDAGVGKTTLINALTETVSRDVAWAVIGDPRLSRLDFYNAIARGFKIDKECTSKVQFLIQFSSFLHKAHDDNKKVLLLVDDCHLLSQDMLEELRLLSNIEKEEEKLINIFFIGRREFNDMLVQPKNRAVGQRLMLQAELVALTLDETGDYIRHRLNIAGADEKMFTAKAMQIIHRWAGGIPRLINILCGHAMVAGSVQGKRTLDHQVLEGCLQRLDLPIDPSQDNVSGLAVDKSHVQHFAGRFAADSSATADKVAGFNLESDQRWGWVKYVLGGILVTVTGGYFYFPAAPPRETARVESETLVQQPAKKELIQAVASPAVAMLEQNEQAITATKAAVLKQAILEKAYNGGDDKARPRAAAQTGTGEAVRTEEKTGQVSAAEPQPPTPGAEEAVITAVRLAPIEPNRVVLRLHPDSLELTGEAAGKLRSFVEKLRDYPRAKLQVKGFVSAKTNSPEHVKLSEERAMVVQKLLVGSGIEPARIDVRGMGNQEAVASNDTRQGRAKNRRVEIVVVSDGR